MRYVTQRIETMEASQEGLESQPSLPTTDPQPRNTGTGFLDLPFELRLEIYYYSIPTKFVINAGNPRFPIFNSILDNYYMYFMNPHAKNNNILLLSKQISNECLDILYGENFFKVQLNGGGEYYLKRNFTDKNRARMKNITVIAQPSGISYPDSLPNVQLWASTLPCLKTIRIIAEQPLCSHVPWFNTIEKQKREWIQWIERYFKEFGRLLVDLPAIIEVDCDGREETNGLVDKYLPNTCRKIQCPEFGDIIFRRGRFSSIGPVYWDGWYD